MKIVIVDDQEEFRESLKIVLSRIKDVEIIGEAADGQAFLDLLQDVVPDVVFMDIEMPGMNGIEATKRAAFTNKFMTIIALTFHNDMSYVKEMIFSGARTYLVKDELSLQTLKNVLHDLNDKAYVT
ncbi:MAG: response regulator [Bacteroidota bacterium]